MTAAGKPPRLDARALRDMVLDEGSWKSWDSPSRRAPWTTTTPPSWPRPRRRPARTSRSSPVREAARASRRRRRRGVRLPGRVDRRRGGERLIAAVERATEEGLPLLAAPVSGGTRMQEGTVAFLQMIGITAAAARPQGGRLPYLVYLRNPTSAGCSPRGVDGPRHDRRAGRLHRLPGPPRVRGALRRAVPAGRPDRGAPGRTRPDRRRRPARADRRGRRPGPAGARGALDVAPRRRRRRAAHRRGRHGRRRPEDGRSAWDVVTASRREDRPGVRRLLRTAATDIVGLSGTGAGEKDRACCWPWPGSAARPAWCSGRTGAASR